MNWQDIQQKYNDRFIWNEKMNEYGRVFASIYDTKNDKEILRFHLDTHNSISFYALYNRIQNYVIKERDDKINSILK